VDFNFVSNQGVKEMTALSTCEFRQSLRKTSRGRRLNRYDIPADLDMGEYNVRYEGGPYPFVVFMSEQIDGYTLENELVRVTTFAEALSYMEEMLGV